MKYNPADGQPSLVPDGTYDATLEAAETVSKSGGNPMLVVTATVYHNAQPFPIVRYFVLNSQSGLSGLKRLCQAIDLDYDRGEITAPMVSGKGCQVHIKTQKDDTGQYWDKNVIAGFAKQSFGDATATTEASPPASGDDVPF